MRGKFEKDSDGKNSKIAKQDNQLSTDLHLKTGVVVYQFEV